MKILVAACHPDDEVLGCGGTIAKFMNGEGSVRSVIFSYGENSNIWEDEKELMIKRIEESKKAAEILGLKNVIFLGVPDNLMKKELKEDKIKERFDKILERTNPDIIFTHSVDDPHPAHSAVARFVKSRVNKTKIKSEIYTFNVWSPLRILHRDEPRMVIDITETLKVKKEALKAFESQKMWLHYPGTLSLLKDRFNGLKEGLEAVEVFHKWR